MGCLASLHYKSYLWLWYRVHIIFKKLHRHTYTGTQWQSPDKLHMKTNKENWNKKTPKNFLWGLESLDFL